MDLRHKDTKARRHSDKIRVLCLSVLVPWCLRGVKGCWSGLLRCVRLNHFRDFDQYTTERLAEASSDTRVYLNRNRYFLIRKVHHVSHVTGKESAVTAGCAGEDVPAGDKFNSRRQKSDVGHQTSDIRQSD